MNILKEIEVILFVNTCEVISLAGNLAYCASLQSNRLLNVLQLNRITEVILYAYKRSKVNP